MGYLMGFLKDDALNAVKGLLVINENYDWAFKMLEERFGDSQLLIHRHMTTLLSLDTISSIFDLKNLRKVYDEVETQIRSLEDLGLDLKSYESLLAPVLMSKLPDELKLLTSHQFGKNVWEITEIMKLFRNELDAREKINVEDNLVEKPIKTVLKKINLVRTLNKHLKKINMVKVNSCYAYFVDENVSLFRVILLLNLTLEKIY